MPVGKRELNSFCLEAHMHGIPCWDKDLRRYIYSTRIAGYHPLRLYMQELPTWDGVDRLTALALRVSDTPLWMQGFHRWMLGLAAQWMGQTGIHANSVAPILVSSEQGRQKSTFCKALMSAVLQRYYIDSLKLISQGQAERLLAEMGLKKLKKKNKAQSKNIPCALSLKNNKFLIEVSLAKLQLPINPKQ